MTSSELTLEVDMICSVLKSVFPAEAALIATVNTFIDKYADNIAPLIPNGLALQPFLQAVFDALNSHLASRPFLLAFAKAIEAWVMSQLPQAIPVFQAQGFTV